MTRRFALLLLLAGAVPALAQDAVVPSDRVTSFVNVCAEASTDSMVVGRLNVGESARLIQSLPRWHEIQLADGTTGFVAKSFTTLTQALAPADSARPFPPDPLESSTFRGHDSVPPPFVYQVFDGTPLGGW